MKRIIIVLIAFLISINTNLLAQGDLTVSFLSSNQFYKNLNNIFTPVIQNMGNTVTKGESFGFKMSINDSMVIDSTYVLGADRPNGALVEGSERFLLLRELILGKDSIKVECAIDYTMDTDTTNNKVIFNVPLVEPPANLDFRITELGLFINNQLMKDTIEQAEMIDSLRIKVLSNYSNFPFSALVTNRLQFFNNDKEIKHFHFMLRRFAIRGNSMDFIYKMDWDFHQPFYHNGYMEYIQFSLDTGWNNLCVVLDELADVNPSNDTSCIQFYVRPLGKNTHETVQKVETKKYWYANGFLHLVGDSLNLGKEGKIINIQGQILQRISIEQSKQQIDVQSLPNGIYFLQIQTPTTTEMLKFVKY